jgi:hypothetical protein
MVFPKWKGSQNKIKSSVRKRKVLKAIALACILLFGKPRLSFSRSSSSNLDNQVVLERVIEERDMQVIKIDGKVKDGLSHKSSNHLIKTGSGILIISLHRRPEVDLVGLYMYQNIVQRLN